MKPKFSEIYWPLRLAYALVPLLAGAARRVDGDGDDMDLNLQRFNE